MSAEQPAPERVTDKELAEIERLVPESVAANEWYAEHGPLLAAEVRARREEAAAISRLLDEAGVAAREGETLLERVAALTVDACASRMTCERLIAERNEQRARAEAAEAELAALRAPVDVEAEVQALVSALTPNGEERRALAREAFDNGQRHKSGFSVGSWELWLAERAFARVRLRDVVAPYVVRAAQLAREAEGLRADAAELTQARLAMCFCGVAEGQLPAMIESVIGQLQNTRAELAKVVLERDAVRLRCDLRIAERDEALQQLTAARAEIERLTKALAEAVEQRENLLAEVERLRADLARETARRDDQIAQLERRLGERETEATQYRVAASRAAEVLRIVEWSGVADGGDPGPEPGGCPCCGADKPGPHAAHCALDACLPNTPETVLRTMLLAAEQRALAMSVSELTGETYPSSLRDAEEATSRIRRVLGHFLATGRLDLGGFDYGLSSQEREEYEARLSGARPLNAPPLEAS